MERSKSWTVERRGPVLRRVGLRGILIAAALLGGLCNAERQAANAAEPAAHASSQLLATPVRFNDLIRLLEDPNYQVRLEAINYLGVLNRPASDIVPPLVRRFNDPDLRVRIHAVRVATRAGMPVQQAVVPAAQCLVPDYPDVCCLAAQILADAGPAATEALPQLRVCQSSPMVWVRLNAARATIRIDPLDTSSLKLIRLELESDQPEVIEFATRALGEIVDGLEEQLTHIDPSLRRAAILRLEQLGPSAESATHGLTARLADTDLLVRAHAARAVFRLGAPASQIVGILADLVLQERVEVTRFATMILVEIGPDAADALPSLHACLKSPSIAVRLHAAEAALRIAPGDRSALSALVDSLGSDRHDVRYFAVNALGAAVMDSNDALLILQFALADPHPKVATAAALHLSRTHDLPRRPLPSGDGALTIATKPTAEAIVSWISELSNTSADVRRQAAICLGLAGPSARRAVSELHKRLGDPEPFVRLHAAQAIWDIERNGYSILPVVIDLALKNEGNTRIGAVYLLSRMGTAASDTTPWIVQMLSESKSFDRLLLAEAVTRIDPTDLGALNVLVHGLRSTNPDVRYLSTVALGAAPLSRKAAVEQALSVAIDDQNSRVRTAACETVSQLLVRDTVAREISGSSVR